MILLALSALAACSPVKTREQAAAEFEQQLLAEPQTREFWDAVKEDFPDEFADLVARGVDAEMNGALTREEGVALGREWMLEFDTKYAGAIQQASAPHIAAMLASTVDLIETFEARDTASCAMLSTGQTFDTSAMSPRVQDAVQRNRIDMVRAMGSGRKSSTPRGDPDAQDFEALYAKMRALGATERLMEILSDESKLLAASADDQCAIGTTLYRAAAALPAERSARLAAYLLGPPDQSAN